MTGRSRHRAVVLAAGALTICAWAAWPVGAQAPTKRPLTYDVYESWRSIGGTRLSEDGQWLAYALTSQAEDGELIVRNLRTNQELKHPRGTSPQFTPDGKFVIFTIVPPKSENDDDDQNENEEAGQGGRGGRGAGQTQNQNRNSVGIMTLPDGKVSTVEQIGSFRLPEESSTWLATLAAPANMRIAK